MKVQSKIFKGIEYVQVNLLPLDQRESIQQSINQKLFIKILIDGKVVGNCLQYKDYEMWYENVFRPETVKQAPKKNKDSAAPVASV